MLPEDGREPDPWGRDESPDGYEALDGVAEDAEPTWFPGHHLPADARRMGLTHHVPEGALLDFAGTLDGAKPVHRVAAWVLLFVFGMPVVFAVLRVWQALVA